MVKTQSTVLRNSSIGDFKRRQHGRIKKLYRLHGKKFVPDNVFDYSRPQLTHVINMLEKELKKPTLATEEMFDIIEKLKPNLHIGKAHSKSQTDLKVGKISSMQQANRVIISLSSPSKMPCYGYSLPAQACITGSKLVNQKDTICAGCYSLKGWYLMEWVQTALQNRLKAIWNKDWVDAMVYAIKFRNQTFFRWHDSGDLQSVQHLDNIVTIAKRLPNVKFWLPTREYSIVENYWRNYAKKTPLDVFVPNLIIRLSANKFDINPPVALAQSMGVQTSRVSVDCPSCPAHLQNGKCLDCRNCWDNKMFCITYLKH